MASCLWSGVSEKQVVYPAILTFILMLFHYTTMPYALSQDYLEFLKINIRWKVKEMTIEIASNQFIDVKLQNSLM